MAKYIRIVGGQYRRTPIDVPEAEGLRPTPDRVRETLFNWLHHLWQGAFGDKQVLDLFAGSGALGFEAASRGVAHVQMVERQPKAVSGLRKLRDKFGATNVRIHAGDAKQTLTRLDNTRFDLIFLDPPFHQHWFPHLLDDVMPLLNTAGLVYAETESPMVVPESYIALRQGRAGAVHYQLLQRREIL
jgi:16S rRNA (guanine(966)-N(2))-methyltransferase RsmD